MSYEDFEKELEAIKLSKKDFSDSVGMTYTSVTNWKQKGEIPAWVSSWLDNYKKAQTLQKITEAIKPFVAN